jgi:hypothetical protein
MLTAELSAKLFKVPNAARYPEQATYASYIAMHIKSFIAVDSEPIAIEIPLQLCSATIKIRKDSQRPGFEVYGSAPAVLRASQGEEYIADFYETIEPLYLYIEPSLIDAYVLHILVKFSDVCVQIDKTYIVHLSIGRWKTGTYPIAPLKPMMVTCL